MKISLPEKAPPPKQSQQLDCLTSISFSLEMAKDAIIHQTSNFPEQMIESTIGIEIVMASRDLGNAGQTFIENGRVCIAFAAEQTCRKDVQQRA